MAEGAGRGGSGLSLGLGLGLGLTERVPGVTAVVSAGRRGSGSGGGRAVRLASGLTEDGPGPGETSRAWVSCPGWSGLSGAGRGGRPAGRRQPERVRAAGPEAPEAHRRRGRVGRCGTKSTGTARPDPWQVRPSGPEMDPDERTGVNPDGWSGGEPGVGQRVGRAPDRGRTAPGGRACGVAGTASSGARPEVARPVTAGRAPGRALGVRRPGDAGTVPGRAPTTHVHPHRADREWSPDTTRPLTPGRRRPEPGRRTPGDGGPGPGQSLGVRRPVVRGRGRVEAGRQAPGDTRAGPGRGRTAGAR